MFRIYLAARYGRREELVLYKQQIERLDGFEVCASWLDGTHESHDHDILQMPGLANACAETDFADIDGADLFIAFAEPATATGQRGGRHVEFGYAYACAMPVWLIGDPEHIFHLLMPVLKFHDWPSAFKELTAMHADMESRF